MNPAKILWNLRGTSEAIFGDKNRLFELIKNAGSKSSRIAEFSTIQKDMNVLLRMVKDVAQGRYTLSKSSVLMVVGALVYLLNPMDIVPDFILGLGFLDDLSIFTYLIAKLRNELESYDTWSLNNQHGK
ncbi:DUF1232 domain-containing protein [Peptoniphilus equinus]|uniref:DUF1232 domain-containing protein n=1 Tax=Peptoniphilus equinus TaxID=3016343 RepID=A0ABY7QRS8_9FIRM|nr:DUF1232 domain-containing protein [Peptoniphilus equinus]WBW49488.1 DUF1232 domain-containing protein [Peptoniphilus equinus]